MTGFPADRASAVVAALTCPAGIGSLRLACRFPCGDLALCRTMAVSDLPGRRCLGRARCLVVGLCCPRGGRQQTGFHQARVVGDGLVAVDSYEDVLEGSRACRLRTPVTLSL